MRRFIISLATIAFLALGADRANAGFIGWTCIDQRETDSGGTTECHFTLLDGSETQRSPWKCFDDQPEHSWSITGACDHDKTDWKDLNQLDFPKNDETCPWHRDDDCNGGSVTPSITPSVTPGTAVPLPPAVWGGIATLIGVVAVTKGRKVLAA